MIFGIGLPKTGNTSLATFLRKHGLTGVQYPSRSDWENLEKFDFVVDTPCNLYFQELYQRFPQAKFVLTHRNEIDWRRSWVKHIQRREYSRLNDWEKINRIALTKRLNSAHQHRETVKRFFQAHNRQSLFIFDLDNKDKEGLCEFLDLCCHIDYPYPKRNVTLSQEF